MMEQNKDLTVDIALAVKKLEFFSDNSLHEKTHPLQRSIHLAKQLIATTFSVKARKKELNRQVVLQTEILDAVKTIQKNYLLIQKLKKGTDIEQAIADSAIKVVSRYNEIVKKNSSKALPLNRKISDFIYKNCGFSEDLECEKEMIYMPSEAFVEFTYSTNKNANKKISKTAFSSIQGNECISQIEADTLRMKLISLLPSAREEFQTIRSTPIQAVVDQYDVKKIIMSQIVKPFPGEIIAIKGEFLRNQNKSVPVKESFELFTNSYQTGFPHPLQHTGFALSDCLIPLCPLKLNVLKNFEPVLKCKQQIASALLPKGNLNLKAKEILKLKKQAVEERKNKFLTLHLKLYVNIFHAKNEDTEKNDLKIITEYFKKLEDLPSIYSTFAETQELITEHFILKPFDTLKDAFLDQKNEDLFSKTLKTRYLASLDILEQEQLKAINALQNKTDAEFICKVGSLLGSSCNQIILQHMSETIGFHPPKLSLFEKKLQLSLYKELISFQNELFVEKQDLQSIQNRLFNQLESDILVFTENAPSAETIPQAIVDELEAYYEKQFYSNAK